MRAGRFPVMAFQHTNETAGEASLVYQWPESLMVRFCVRSYACQTKALRIAFGPFEIVHSSVMIGRTLGRAAWQATLQVAAQELMRRSSGGCSSGNRIGAAILSDFQGRGFVFAGDAENEIVEASANLQAKSVSGPSWASNYGRRSVFATREEWRDSWRGSS